MTAALIAAAPYIAALIAIPCLVSDVVVATFAWLVAA